MIGAVCTDALGERFLAVAARQLVHKTETTSEPRVQASVHSTLGTPIKP